MNNRNRWNRVCRSIAVVVLVCVVLVGQVMAQGPLRGPSGEIILGLGTLLCAAYSPDGKYIATGGGLGAFIWNTQTGSLVRWFSEHTGAVYCVAFSPDGTKMLTGSGSPDKTTKLWDMQTGEVLQTFSSGDMYWVSSVGFSTDGSQVVTGGRGWVGSGDSTEALPMARLWDVETGAVLQTFWCSAEEYTYASVVSVAISPNGQHLLTGNDDWDVSLWDVETGAEMWTVSDGGYSVVFSPDGTKVLTGNYDKTAQLWDSATGALIRTFSGHTDSISSVAFSPDGTRVLTADGSTAKLWDTETGAVLRTVSARSGYIHLVAFAPDGPKALTTSSSPNITVQLLDLNMNGVFLRTFEGHTGDYHGGVPPVAFSPDGTRVLTADGYTAKLWDAETGLKIWTFYNYVMSDPTPQSPVSVICSVSNVDTLAFSPDGTMILTDSPNDGARLWDSETGAEIRTFSGHTSRVYSVAYSPDGTKILTGSWDETAKLWDVQTGQEIRTFSGHTGSVNSVAFSPDGTKVLTGSDDKTAKLWDAETGVEIHSFPHNSMVDCVAFSPDGKKVLTDARMWDVETGTEIRTFSGHTGSVYSVAFSPDGTKVLTGIGYPDYIAALWDTDTGQEIRTFSGHTGDVRSVAFSPDGTKVLTGSWDGTARIWNIELISPTPTNTPTLEPTQTPTRTPIPTAIATPEPSTSEMTPWRVFPFDSAQEFQRYPGGFVYAQAGNVSVGEIPEGSEGFTDGQGATISTNPGQLELLVFPTLDIGENAALIRLSVQSIGAGAAIGLGALDGSNDGSIATNIPANSGVFEDGYHRLVLLYDPPGNSIVPVVQVANLPGTENVLVYLDNLEIYLIPADANVPGRLLRGE